MKAISHLLAPTRQQAIIWITDGKFNDPYIDTLVQERPSVSA